MNQERKYRKVYVDMLLEMKRDGTVLPKCFIWEDGEKYIVERVRYIEYAASTKVGGRGIRYTVKINGLDRYIFREEDRWFVEAIDN